MTRRQAIQVILSYLENKDDLDGNLREATVLLREFLTVLPIKIWDDQNIRQSVENFISVFHHSPSVKELDTTPSLPSHTIIKNYYKVTAGEWLLKNYPQTDYGKRPHGPIYIKKYPDTKQLLEIFESEYNRTLPSSSVAYNKERNPSTPSWQYIAKRAGVKTWNELREKCGIPLRIPKKKTEFKVSSFAESKGSKHSMDGYGKRKSSFEITALPSGYINVRKSISLKRKDDEKDDG